MTRRLWLRPAHHYTRLRLGAIGTVGGAVGGTVGELVSHNLLNSPEDVATVDLVLVSGASIGGPARLTEPVIEALLHCERQSVPTVLLAGEVSDFDTPVAAVCRDVAGTDSDVITRARVRFGVERVHFLPPRARRALPGARRRHPRTHLPPLKNLARGVGLVTPWAPLPSLLARINGVGRMRTRSGSSGR